VLKFRQAKPLRKPTYSGHAPKQRLVLDSLTSVRRRNRGFVTVVVKKDILSKIVPYHTRYREGPRGQHSGVCRLWHLDPLEGKDLSIPRLLNISSGFKSTVSVPVFTSPLH
jgi:hypothetical protein